MSVSSQATITRFFQVTKNYHMTEVDQLGDLTGLIPGEAIETVMSGRRTIVHNWMDEDGINGYEQRVHYLHDWEIESAS